MKCSIVIVSYNSEDFLGECLRSVFEHTTGLSYEVWVVDNGSRDHTVESVRSQFSQVHLIVNDKNLGFSRACNQAILHSTGEYILLLNPDTVILNNAIGRLMAYMDAHLDVGMAGGKVLNSDGTPQAACRRGMPTPWAMLCKATGLDRMFSWSRSMAEYNLLWRPWDQEADVVSVSGSFQMARRSVIESIGLLDEAIFMYGEDIDWCLRTREAGWRVVYFPGARIIHYKGRSSKKEIARARSEFYRSYLYLYEKWFAKKGNFLGRWLVSTMVATHRALSWRFMR
ncbi:MAG: glycosyltransferase family 2 protein [Candidatus Binatia bacterium]